jgi:hypothetical protein
MKNNSIVEEKLEIVRDLQKEFESSYVGGSLSLLVRGIDLKRSLDESDIDLIIQHSDFEKFYMKSWECVALGNSFDFDYKVKLEINGNKHKMDVSLTKIPNFDVVEYQEHFYRVNNLQVVLEYKKKYANEGDVKHRNDLITIETGVRPKEETTDEYTLPY